MAEFFNMGGYALYVWSSFGVTAVLMLAEPILLRQRRRSVLQRVRRLHRIQSEEQQ
ncbi:MAG: heme exporter protein CcmD [Proteobacteria bacterium]|nr:heme exporter protein CcmD [Pseudomonadota bacterium]MCG6936223.1 heme exporter protein CcmD [Pseudomonadota bacterium]